MLRSPVTWVIILGVTVGAGAIILWRRRNASSNATAGSTGTSTADTGTTATDTSGALGTLQTEIADLQSSEAQDDKTATATSSATAPRVPPVITVVSPRTGAVDIAWTAVPGAAGYQLDITGPGNTAVGAPRVAATHTRVTLPAGKKGMHVKVRAYNKAGAGPWSASRRFNVGAGAARVPVSRKAA